MASTVYYAAMSLDGYIAEPEEKLEWLTGFDGPGYAGEAESPGPMAGSYQEFYEGIGAFAMGAKTYEFLLDEGWAYGDMPAWVYTSRDLPAIEGAGGLRFASGDVAELHGEILAAAGDKDLWMVGGGDLASQYAEAGLLDYVRVTVVPVVLGGGLPLFAKPHAAPMRLLGVTPFGNGMTELSYEIDR